MTDKSIDLGFGHYVPCSKVQFVLSPSRPTVSQRRFIETVEARGDLIDLAGSSKCRSLVVVLDFVAPKVLKSVKTTKHLVRQISDSQSVTPKSRKKS